jgi:AraC family transcriptional regulator
VVGFGDQSPPLTLTRLRLLDVPPDISQLPFEDAAVFTLAIGGQFERDVFLNRGSSPRSASVPQGSSSFVDLREGLRLRMTSDVDVIQLSFPLRSLGRAIEEERGVCIDRLGIESGDVLTDPTLSSLAAVMLPAFLRPQEANRLFVDHVGRAAACYVAQKFGRVGPSQPARRGGLAAWQESRAKQMIDSQLDGGVSLDVLASECGLSTSHFIRAFRISVGIAPHQWLMRRRIDQALNLLRDRSLSLSQIALACGFADQSHFTRSFTAAIGESPGAYRRANGVATNVESNH